MQEFEELTLQYLKDTDVRYRKRLGQYFTPKSIREKLLAHIPRTRKGLRVLDPSCGTGEFLVSAKAYFPQARLEGWEIDGELVRIAKRVVPSALLRRTNALEETATPTYDIVIGNPPYYEFSPAPGIRRRFQEIICGRANIFAFFIKLGLDLLKEGGYLTYVVPPSMNNGAYFARLRQFIIQNANVEYMEILEKTALFEGASQMTMLLVLRKGKNRGDYLFRRNGIEIFTRNPAYLEEALRDKTTFHEMGWRVRTGRLVWNENKGRLSRTPENHTVLIWSHNITPRGLAIDGRLGKPQYVKTDNADKGPAIVVNRITGAAGSARLRAALIPKGLSFIAENHTHVIYPPSKNIARQELEHVLSELRAEKNVKVIQHITGNTQLSKNELEKLLPLARATTLKTRRRDTT